MHEFKLLLFSFLLCVVIYGVGKAGHDLLRRLIERVIDLLLPPSPPGSPPTNG